jgi:hypothetical protein
MTPVSTLSVFWVFLEALSEKQSAEELEATSSSFSLPLSLSLDQVLRATERAAKTEQSK